jgi:hypothetical protein
MKNKLDLLLQKFEKASKKRVALWKEEHALEMEEQKKREKLEQDFKKLKKEVMRPMADKLAARLKNKGFTFKRHAIENHFEQYIFDYPKEEDTSLVFCLKIDLDTDELVFATQYQSYITEPVDKEIVVTPDQITEAFIEKHFLRMLKKLGKK